MLKAKTKPGFSMKETAKRCEEENATNQEGNRRGKKTEIALNQVGESIAVSEAKKSEKGIGWTLTWRGRELAGEYVIV